VPIGKKIPLSFLLTAS